MTYKIGRSHTNSSDILQVKISTFFTYPHMS
uniref:Uncharacterized protein n=1 Tax=Lepeophtheirus salmonis TaxID=72036 RepID=A0A0K2UU03_LEPSM